MELTLNVRLHWTQSNQNFRHRQLAKGCSPSQSWLGQIININRYQLIIIVYTFSYQSNFSFSHPSQNIYHLEMFVIYSTKQQIFCYFEEKKCFRVLFGAQISNLPLFLC